MTNQGRYDVVVIGGGAAGLSAAIAAKQAGVSSILVLERGEVLGGILPQCVHTGFGLHYLKENLTGPEYIDQFVKKVPQLGIGSELKTMALDLTPNLELAAVNQSKGVLRFKAGAVVLAMGCRERSRGALGMPGTRPAGILTAGAAQRLMDIEGYLPGKRVLIVGSGDIGLIMARRFAMEGAEVEGVIEIMPFPGGLERNLQILRDFEVPLYLSHAVNFVHGSERVEAVTIAELDGDGKPTGHEKRIECDTLILSVGLIPENELSKKAGVKLDPRTGGAIVDENLETSIKGIFACGNVVHVHDLVDHVTKDGEEAGMNAARRALGELPPLEKRIRLKAGRNVRYVVPQVISGAKPLTLYARMERPASDVVITMGKFQDFPMRIVRPPETVTLNLTKDSLRMIGDGDNVTVSMRERSKHP